MIVEVQRNPKRSKLSDCEVGKLVETFLGERPSAEVYTNFKGTVLEGIVDRIVIDKKDKVVASSLSSAIFYYYYLNTDGSGAEIIDCDTTSLNAAHVTTLPCKEFDGIWENLYFDSDVKFGLLDYSAKALVFAERGVDQNVIACNKLVLLYGPPGTGKTSLCKAVAQKLSIRWQSRFPFSHFVEVNAHSLFSKYFSESGKLVMKMFEKIFEIVSDNTSLVIVLIDEVESLAHSRAAAAASHEPSDAIRVVNALLTQIDRLKVTPNVLVLTTSNVETSIDGAFVDRADLCIRIGQPSTTAISKIFGSCVRELVKRDLLEDKAFDETSELSSVWLEICRMAVGISGRSLRKLPLLAYCEGQQPMSMTLFLDSLAKLVKSKTAAHHMFPSISLV